MMSQRKVCVSRECINGMYQYSETFPHRIVTILKSPFGEVTQVVIAVKWVRWRCVYLEDVSIFWKIFLSYRHYTQKPLVKVKQVVIAVKWVRERCSMYQQDVSRGCINRMYEYSEKNSSLHRHYTQKPLFEVTHVFLKLSLWIKTQINSFSTRIHFFLSILFIISPFYTPSETHVEIRIL